MSNSSDWIHSLAQLAAPEPGWIAAVSAGGAEFREGAHFIAAAHGDQSRSWQQAPQGPACDNGLAQAYAAGEAAGRAAAIAEVAERADRQRALRLAFGALDQAALDALAGELTETVIALCGQVIDATAIDAAGLADRAAEAARRLGSASENCTLRLHPDDIAMLSEEATGGWRVLADPALARGALRLEAAEGEVHDGPDEWRRAIAGALRG